MRASSKSGNPEITTTWRLHAWWLVALSGYRVRMVIEKPRGGLLARMRYSTTWVLEQPGSGRR